MAHHQLTPPAYGIAPTHLSLSFALTFVHTFAKAFVCTPPQASWQPPTTPNTHS
jgi:hypothetical protein